MKNTTRNTKKDSIDNGEPKRVPIPMNAKENAELTRIAKRESRSKSSMAKIIYALGMQAYSTRS